jgi:hypothetical protein
MKNKTNYAIILLTLFLVWTFFAGCDIGPSGKPTTDPTDPATPTGNGSILGRVVDESEEPIEGATVSLYFGKQLEGSDFTRSGGTLSDTDTTDEAGGYSFKNLATDYEYYLVIEAPGKKTLKISFNLSSNSVQYLQSLLPEGSGTIEAVLPVPITLAAPSRTGDNVTLTWSQSVNDNFQAYTVLRNESAEFDPDAAVIVDNVTTKATVTTTDTLPNPDTTYFYRVFEKVSAGGDVYIWVGSNVVNTAFTIGDPEWSQLGTETFTGAFREYAPMGCDIAVDNGIVYLAFISQTNVNRVQKVIEYEDTVDLYKYENGLWTKAGSFEDNIQRGSLKIVAADGTPYVTYVEKYDSYCGILKKFDGEKWVTLKDGDKDNFSSDESVGAVSIAINDGAVYVAYNENSFSIPQSYKNLVTLRQGVPGFVVRKYENGTWSNVGNKLVEEIDIICSSLKFNNGVPYVALGCYGVLTGYSGSVVKGELPMPRITSTPEPNFNNVYKFESESWTQVGADAFNEDIVHKVDLAFLGNVPYVSFSSGLPGNVYAKKLISGSWHLVGDVIAESISDYAPLNFVNYDNTLTMAIYSGIEYKETETEYINVYKLEGSAWSSIGAGEFADGTGRFVRMVGTDNKLYVLYINSTDEIDFDPNPNPPERLVNGNYHCEFIVKQYAPVPKNNK